jgi:hypothetical protein
MTSIETWIAAHQMLLLILWPTLTGVASLVYKMLDADTRAHAVFSFLASIGIDIPKIIDAVGRMITPPNAAKKPPSPPVGLAVFVGFFLMAAGATTTILGVGFVASNGCAPAQIAEEQRIEQTVLADIVAGKSRQQIEADVATIIAGQPGADIAAIVDAALVLLVDVGVIPPNVLPTAVAMLPPEKRMQLHYPHPVAP